jgi:hypothetical protein
MLPTLSETLGWGPYIVIILVYLIGREINTYLFRISLFLTFALIVSAYLPFCTLRRQ